MKNSSRLLFLVCVIALSLLSIRAAADTLCGAPSTPISKVQGSGAVSPLEGKTVSVEGILTLDSRTRGGFGGFYLQQADHQTDSDPATSEALFVYTDKKIGGPGTRIRVTGKVKEYHGLTELVAIQAVRACGREALPTPVKVDLPWSSDPERLENMRVTFRHPLTVVDNYNLGRYGELALAGSDQIQPTEYLAPGDQARQKSASNQRNRVLLDDNRLVQNPRPLPWPPAGSALTTVRAGDQIDQLVGVLDFRFDAWRLQPERPPRFLNTNPRKMAPPSPSKDSVRVLALNLGNYFNGNGQGGGFPTTRGAATITAFEQQQKRLIQTLLAPDPDILAVTELENDGYGPNSAVAALTTALGRHWRFVSTPGQDGDDKIRTGLLYRSDRVVTVGPPARLTTGPFRARGRPPLAQHFSRPDADETIRIVVPHLKSKSCRGATGDNRDQGDGQGCYASRRSSEANAIAHWLNSSAEPGSSPGTLIVGDLNSYAREQPLIVFANSGFGSLIHRFHPCTEKGCEHYTYRYRGQKGNLDYALASNALVPRVERAQSWLVNADEPRATGYQGGDQLSIPAGPWRSTDHNPVIVDLKL